MTGNSRTVDASPGQVWEVIADGWLYPLWVVGASRIRGVDDHWPDKGSRIHHSFGIWPVVVDDNTEVLECHPGHSIRLRARGWPAGEAEVRLTLTGVGRGCEVQIEEDVSSGPGRLVPPPVRGVTLKWRNAETLRRLALVTEGRAGSDDGP